MSRKKKKAFSAVKEAKRRARLAIGMPRPEKVIPSKKAKAPKHKKALLAEESW